MSMGFPSDLAHWRPMRHHEPDEPLNARAREYGLRYDREALTDPNTGERVKIGKDTPADYGDFPNWGHWQGQKQRTDENQPDGTELGAWYQAMPSMAAGDTVKPMATMVRTDNELRNKQFVTDESIIQAHGKLTAKPRGFAPAVRGKIYPMWPEGDPVQKRIAAGMPGVTLTATYPDEQISLFMPAGNVLISDHRSESPDLYSTMVYDINKDQLSFRYLARLSTAVRVAIAPVALGREPGLALLGTRSPKGFGYASFWFNGSFPQAGKKPRPKGPITGPGGGEPPQTDEQPRPDLPASEPRNGVGVYATFSWEKGGPMHPGAGAGDKHLHATAPDGEPWTGGHTDTQSLYYMDVERDAPLAFESPYYPPVANGPHPYEVHLQYDIKASHVWQGQQKRGLWRWFVRIPIAPPYDGGPPKTPEYPPPWEPEEPPPGTPIPPPWPEPDPKGPPGKNGPPGGGGGGAVITGDKKPQPSRIPGGTPWEDAIPPQSYPGTEEDKPPQYPGPVKPITQDDEEESQKRRKRGQPPDGATQYSATLPAEVSDPNASKIYPIVSPVFPGGRAGKTTDRRHADAAAILPLPGPTVGAALPVDIPDRSPEIAAATIRVREVRARASAVVQPSSTANEFAAPSIHLVAVPMQAKTLSWQRFAPEGELGGFYAAPLVGHFQGAGSETAAGAWNYTKRPIAEGGRGPYISGTSPGVVAFMPPERQIDDVSPWSTTGVSAQTLLIHPANTLAFGRWSSTLAAVTSGFVFSYGSATQLNILCYDSSGGSVTGSTISAATSVVSVYAVHLANAGADPVAGTGTLWFDGTDLWLDAIQITSGGAVIHPDPHRLADGDVTTPAYSFVDETDTGMWRNPAGFDGATTVVINATGIASLEVGTTGVYIPGKLTVDGLIDPTGLVLTEQASTPWTPAAGFGALYVKNTAPSTLIFVDDTGAEVTLGAAGGGLADPGGNGIVVRTALGVTTARTLTGPAAGISVSNGDGVAGNPTLALANDLSALEGLGSTGYAVRTAADTWAQRTVGVGSNSGLAVTNSNGVAGNTSFVIDYSSLAAAIGAPGLTLLMAAGTTTPSSYSVQQVFDAVGSLSTLVDTTLAVTDSVPVYDASASALKRMVIDEFMGGSISVLTADATPDGAADYVVTFDASAGTGKKVLLNNLPSGLNISGLTAETGTIDDVNDYIPFYDASAAANKKISPEYLFSVADQLTQLTAVAVGDIVPIIDISAGAPKARYSTVEDLFDAVAGFTTLTGIAVATGSYDMIPIWDTSAAAIRQVSPENIGVPLVAYCSSDQTVSSTTQTNATGMVLTLTASAWYSFEMELRFNSATTGGVKFDLDGSTLTVTAMSYCTWISTTTGTAGDNVIALSTTALATDVQPLASGTASNQIVQVRGFIQVNAGGTLQFRFSRVGASGSATLKTGSWMRCQRMA